MSWGQVLHDRFLLPYWMWRDFEDVLGALARRGLPLPAEAYRRFLELRRPVIGPLSAGNVTLELRNAIEPWHVLGEQVTAGGTSRFATIRCASRCSTSGRSGRSARARITCGTRRVACSTRRRARRFTLVGPPRWPLRAEPALAHPDAPYTIDLRRLPLDHPLPPETELIEDSAALVE